MKQRDGRNESGGHEAESSEGGQQRQLSDAHVAPITDFVDSLRAADLDRWVPYVAPYHGGIEAQILVIFQDPGHKTVDSGMIGAGNDDPSAARFARCLDAAEVSQHQVVPWNIYPWYRRDQEPRLTAKMLNEGLAPLKQLLGLLLEVHTVVTAGKVAEDGWARFARQYPGVAGQYRLLDTRHTSDRGITNGGGHSREEGERHVVETLRKAASAGLPALGAEA